MNILTEDCHTNDTTLRCNIQILHPAVPSSNNSNISLCTHIIQSPPGPTHIMPAPSPPHVVRNVCTDTLPSPSIQEVDSDWLNTVSSVTSVGDCVMTGHNVVKNMFPNAEYDDIWCSGHVRLWINENKKTILNTHNVDIIHRDFNLVQQYCRTPEAVPLVFDLMVKKWNTVLHETHFTLLFNKSWRHRFCPRVVACITDGTHAYSGIPNQNLGLEGSLFAWCTLCPVTVCPVLH